MNAVYTKLFGIFNLLTAVVAMFSFMILSIICFVKFRFVSCTSQLGEEFLLACICPNSEFT